MAEKKDDCGDKKDARNPFKVPRKKPKFMYSMECEEGKGGANLDTKAIGILQRLYQDHKKYAHKIQYTEAGRIKYNDPYEFKIGYFNFELPEDAFSAIVVGKRRTGKSVFTKDFVWNCNERFDEVYVFTKTKINDWYQGWLHECYVYEGYKPDIAEQIFSRALQKEWAYRRGKTKKRARILILCDDLLSDRNHRHDETLESLYTLGRHVDISVMYLSQKFKGLPPVFRDNSDLMVCFNMFNSNEAKQLAEEFLGGLNIRTAQEMLDLYCSQAEHTALIIETWRNCRDPEVFMKFYQAEGELHINKGDIGSREYNEEAQRQEQYNADEVPTAGMNSGPSKGQQMLEAMDYIF